MITKMRSACRICLECGTNKLEADKSVNFQKVKFWIRFLFAFAGRSISPHRFMHALNEKTIFCFGVNRLLRTSGSRIDDSMDNSVLIEPRTSQSELKIRKSFWTKVSNESICSANNVCVCVGTRHVLRKIATSKMLRKQNKTNMQWKRVPAERKTI